MRSENYRYENGSTAAEYNSIRCLTHGYPYVGNTIGGFSIGPNPITTTVPHFTEFGGVLRMRVWPEPVVLAVSMFNSPIARRLRWPRSVYSESVADETNLRMGAHKYRLQ